MLPQPLIFLDLETTGMTATHERITEIGLVEVANGEFAGSWSQLVNPEKSIPPFIQSLALACPTARARCARPSSRANSFPNTAATTRIV